MLTQHPKTGCEWPVYERFNVIEIKTGGRLLKIEIFHPIDLEVEELLILDTIVLYPPF